MNINTESEHFAELCRAQSQSQSCSKALQVHLAWPHSFGRALCGHPASTEQGRSSHKSGGWRLCQQMNFRILCKLDKAKIIGEPLCSYSAFNQLCFAFIAQASRIPVTVHSCWPTRLSPSGVEHSGCLDYLHKVVPCLRTTCQYENESVYVMAPTWRPRCTPSPPKLPNALK